MSKIAIISDTHCGVRGSAERFIKYQERFWTEIFFPELRKRGIKEIWHLGDYYDSPSSINYKALQSNRKCFLEVLRDEKMKMLIIPGNHDLYYKHTNQICSIRELHGYYYDEISILMNSHTVKKSGNDFLFVPWINESNFNEIQKVIAESTAQVLLGHFELSGFDMYKGIPSHHGMKIDGLDKFKLVLSGHYHTKSNARNIHYLGAQMEFTWSDCDDQKYFHILDTDTLEIEAIENPLTIFKKFYYNEDEINIRNVDYSQFANKHIQLIVEKRTNDKKFDRFLELLERQDHYDLKIFELFDDSGALNMLDQDDQGTFEDTPDMIKRYVDDTDTNLDKNILKEILQKSYVESLLDMDNA